ncbi:hypothetical protein H7K24_21335 [Mycobacterium fragae]|uniref:DUF732 domain-containing protein n=1 Tax=Mycobacterium fragae TaxID=1260918 RepID=A0A1X1UMG4_9MYCO|nr:hypothetical protein [Mycobacterium fragae]MCV7402686.1 hypothetical protein [Mycobacterium fragae]ORV58034.1 hypothetical protein AWC06_22250 [Mycobacterium fragae]
MRTTHTVAVAAIGLAAAGCVLSHQAPPPIRNTTNTSTSTAPPLSAQLQIWYSHVQPYFQELADAGHRLATAGQNEDLTGLGFACQQLQDAASNLQQHMPTPDPDLTRELQGAISDYDAGSRFCVAGSQKVNMGELEDSLPLLNSANVKMDTATNLLHRDMGSAPSTTTEPSTTGPRPSLPGTDGQGFVESYARCEPGTPPALMARTTKSLVVVCETGPGNYYYRGVRESDGASIELADAVRTSSGFDVTNPTDGTRYQVRPEVLNIISPSGQVDSEPMVQYASS